MRVMATVVVVLAVVAAVIVFGAIGVQSDSSSSSRPVAGRPVSGPYVSDCPAPNAPGGRVLCASGTDMLAGRPEHAMALRVELDQVIAQLEDAASHVKRAPAVGAGCAPPSRGDGVGAPAWPCEVFYTGPPPVTVHYRLLVHPSGCWAATPVLDASVQGRGIARSYAGCGLRLHA